MAVDRIRAVDRTASRSRDVFETPRLLREHERSGAAQVGAVLLEGGVSAALGPGVDVERDDLDARPFDHGRQAMTNAVWSAGTAHAGVLAERGLAVDAIDQRAARAQRGSLRDLLFDDLGRVVVCTADAQPKNSAQCPRHGAALAQITSRCWTVKQSP
jgi:hypothetical protein